MQRARPDEFFAALAQRHAPVVDDGVARMTLLKFGEGGLRDQSTLANRSFSTSVLRLIASRVIKASSSIDLNIRSDKASLPLAIKVPLQEFVRTCFGCAEEPDAFQAHDTETKRMRAEQMAWTVSGRRALFDRTN
jgi:hypothetical protein